VVDGQAKQDREVQHWREGLDWATLADAQRLGTQPDWKIATMTPNDAPAAKRFISAVVSCTSRLRNAIVGSR
jgi:hypothetical protein